jgi:hypothetical protein
MSSLEQQRIMLVVLLGTCRGAATAFKTDNVIDPILRADLNAMIERSEVELERLDATITASEVTPEHVVQSL